MKIEEFFHHLWSDHVALAPSTGEIHRLVEAEGNTVNNDHVAFRTYNLAPIDLDTLEKHILALGYEQHSEYHFEEKHLRAHGFIHPEGHPRIFFSELLTEEFSDDLQKTVRKLVQGVDPEKVKRPEILWSGRPWVPVSHGEYKSLLEESEYAGWMTALGLHANHFTVAVNGLTTFPNLAALLDFVEAQGFPLNTAGGRIKGSPDVLLEQGSTMADRLEVDFAGGERHVIPTCYCEFAERHTDPATGRLFDGFVAASANRIFESTQSKP